MKTEAEKRQQHSEADRRWRAKNAEKIREAHAPLARPEPEKMRESRRRRAENWEKVRESEHRWYAENREKIREYGRRWYAREPGKSPRNSVPQARPERRPPRSQAPLVRREPGKTLRSQAPFARGPSGIPETGGQKATGKGPGIPATLSRSQPRRSGRPEARLRGFSLRGAQRHRATYRVIFRDRLIAQAHAHAHARYAAKKQVS